LSARIVPEARGRGIVAGLSQMDEPGALSPQAKQDRQMLELLNELRVALPGVQILLGFLLTVPFAARFDETSDFQRGVYLVILLATAASTACLIAPAAAHRLRFGQRDRPYLIKTANVLAIAGLACLAVSITGVVLLVSDFVFGTVVTVVATAAVGVLIGGLWFARPLLRRRSRRMVP